LAKRLTGMRTDVVFCDQSAILITQRLCGIDWNKKSFFIVE